MKRAMIMLLVASVVGCAGHPTDHESHRHAIENGKIDYPYWETYLRQHGDAETVAHFDMMLASASDDEKVVLQASFERFCRFQRCLAAYDAKRSGDPN